MNHQGGCGVSTQKQPCWRPKRQSRDGSATFLPLLGSWSQYVMRESFSLSMESSHLPIAGFRCRCMVALRIILASLALFASVAAGAQTPSTGWLHLASPVEYQVSQRTNRSTGPLPIRGSLAMPLDAEVEIQCRLPKSAHLGSWRTIQILAPGKTQFETSIPAPAGGWYPVEVRATQQGIVLDTVSREHVGVGEVFVVAGQSNAANHGEEKQQPGSGLVTTFIGPDWRLAHDPQPGASGNGGSFLPPLGDRLAGHFRVPIGFVSCAVGATSVREWLPKGERFPHPPTLTGNVQELPSSEWESKGNLFDAFTRRVKSLGPAGFRAVLWHQGESDANQRDPIRTLPGDFYQDYLEKLIRTSALSIGWNPPWFVALASYHTPDDPGSPDIRAAQRALWTRGIALEGPDSDALSGDLRDSGGKGVHFSAKGLREHANRWAEKLIPWLDKQSSQP